MEHVSIFIYIYENQKEVSAETGASMPTSQETWSSRVSKTEGREATPHQ